MSDGYDIFPFMRRDVVFLYICAFILVSLGVTGCGRTEAKGDVLVRYDGGSLTKSDFQDALMSLPERVREVALLQKQDFLESLVSEKLLLQEAESRGIQHLADVQDVLRQARDRILVAKLIEEEVEVKSEVESNEIKSYYENNKQEFVSPFRLRASHILLRSRKEADEILKKIKKGESFEELAKKHSLDPTAVKGGDIGYFRKGQLIPEIEEAAFALKKDEISDIIQSTFGFHVIKVTGEAKPQVKEFKLVEKEIEEKLTIEKKSGHFEDLVERLKKKADISFNEEAVDEFNFLEAKTASNR